MIVEQRRRGMGCAPGGACLTCSGCGSRDLLDMPNTVGDKIPVYHPTPEEPITDWGFGARSQSGGLLPILLAAGVLVAVGAIKK
jgi:hypothetical protein